MTFTEKLHRAIYKKSWIELKLNDVIVESDIVELQNESYHRIGDLFYMVKLSGIETVDGVANAIKLLNLPSQFKRVVRFQYEV